MNSIYKYLNKIENDCPGAIKGIAAALIKAQYGSDWKVILPAFYSDLTNELEKINSEKKEMIENDIKIIEAARATFLKAENDLVAVDEFARALFLKTMKSVNTDEYDKWHKQLLDVQTLYKKMRFFGITSVKTVPQI